MTGRGLATAWGLTLTLVLAASLAGARWLPPVFGGAPVIVIGSSLTRNAVPPSGSNLLGQDLPWRRVAESAISEDRTLALAANALDSKPRALLIEANILLFALNHRYRPDDCRQPAAPLRRQLRQLQTRVAETLTLRRAWPEKDAFAADGGVRQDALERVYPLHFDTACRPEQMDVLAQKARAQGTRLILVLPPRSNTARQYIGEAQVSELDRRAQAMAERLGADLFAPAGDWPDAEFTDQAHLNRQGRAHFMRAVQQWGLQRP